MAIIPIDSVTTTTESVLEGRDVIDKDEFMELLVAQLQHQDPLNPMDNAEFTSQMAQFASLEQLQNVNGNLEELHIYQSALFNENAVSFIGKNVKAVDNTIQMTDGVADELHFNLEYDANETYISIYDSGENLVRTIEVTESLEAGDQSQTWDGTDNDGNQLQDGDYTFVVQAVGLDDYNFSGTPYFEGQITAVSFSNYGTAYLTAGGHEIGVGNIIRVFEDE